MVLPVLADGQEQPAPGVVNAPAARLWQPSQTEAGKGPRKGRAAAVASN